MAVRAVRCSVRRWREPYGVGPGICGYGQNVQGWSVWDGSEAITAATGQVITVVECSGDYKALKAGSATVTAKA